MLKGISNSFLIAAACLICSSQCQGSMADTQYGAVEEDNQPALRLKRSDAPPANYSQGFQPQETRVVPQINQMFPNVPPEVPQPQPEAAIESQPQEKWHKGKILTGAAGQDALNQTCILSLAAQQAQRYPVSPEAAFIYAVALTKTSHVETALAEVRRARGLARATGDPNYFNRAVKEYEEILSSYPDDNCIRYGLAWAYYMQAYLYSEQAAKVAQTQGQAQGQAQDMYTGQRRSSKSTRNLLMGAELLASALTGARPDASAVPHIPGALDKAPAWAVPQIQIFYEKCLKMFAIVVAHDPKDTWAAVYKAHVAEELSGDHETAINSLLALKQKHPDNPAVAFFLADAYARGGHYAKGLSNLSRAFQLRNSGQ